MDWATWSVVIAVVMVVIVVLMVVATIIITTVDTEPASTYQPDKNAKFDHYPPNVYPLNPPASAGYYSPLFNTVVRGSGYGNCTKYGCYGASTQHDGSISNGTLPLFYNHSIDSVSGVSPDVRNQRWYGPHSNYLN
jgi:hypothetical protein